MSQYLQLLGTDTPNSYGGCGYFGPIEHPILQPVLDQSKRGTVDTSGPEGYLLFNCPEGTQRFSSEANIRLTRIKGFFFTRWGSDRHKKPDAAEDVAQRCHNEDGGPVTAVMGLPGLLFTVNDAGVRHANVFGPSSVVGATLPSTCSTDQRHGVERLLGTLRRHYFSYRPMTFRQLIPLYTDDVLPGDEEHTGRHEARIHHLYRLRADDGTPVSESCTGPTDEGVAIPTPIVAASSASSAVHQRRTSESPFILAALPLSPSSLLVAFAASHSASGASLRIPVADASGFLHDCSDEVISYAIVHAPMPAFDAQKAKALGVRPGPKYGLLKRGIPVEMDVSDGKEASDGRKRRRHAPNPTLGAESGTSDEGKKDISEDDVVGLQSVPQVIHPRQVSKPTVGSRSIYISLMLDANCEEELRAALERLLGVEEENHRGELYELLRQRFPHLLFYESDSVDGSLVQRERQMHLRQAVHLQPSSYFASAAMKLTPLLSWTTGEFLTAYLRRLFDRVSARVERWLEPTLLAVGGVGGTTDSQGVAQTQHLFSFIEQLHFTAFPTALVHRYHLRHLAPALFAAADEVSSPTPLATTRDDAAPTLTWPYALKWRCLAEDAHQEWERRSSPAKTPAVLFGGASLLSYPHERAALEMLSAEFRRRHHDQAAEPQPLKKSGGGALLFLGTGSAVPSKYRNVSGCCLELLDTTREGTSKGGVIVLDFGEGSLGQLRQMVCPPWRVGSHEDGLGIAVEDYLKQVALVFISHGHADHHLGLMSLLVQRHFAWGEHLPAEPLLVVCPEEVQEFMMDLWSDQHLYHHILTEECRFEVMPCAAKRRGRSPPLPYQVGAHADEPRELPCEVVPLPQLDELCQRWSQQACGHQWPNPRSPAAKTPPVGGLTRDVFAAEVLTVDHPANAHALLLRFPHWEEEVVEDCAASPMTKAVASISSRVLVFSGDTRPSASLVDLSRRFAALGHEGCGEDGSEAKKSDDAASRRVFICLHEATFGPGFEHEAIRKKHSTLPEALSIGRKLDAEFVALNHFSQRYPKLPGLTADHLGGSTVDLHCRRQGRPATRPNDAEVASECNDGVPLAPDAASDAGETDVPWSANMGFAFDWMRIPFALMRTGEVGTFTPTFVKLLEEYESWGVGTTDKLRQKSE